jgi:hypothetical protein
LVFWVILLLPATLHAQFDYTTNNGTITITKYTGPGGDVTIPSETNGLLVTSIGIQAFYNSTAMTSVMIPYSVTNMESNPFGYCTSLTAIMADDSNSVYSSVSGILFSKNHTALINYPGGKAGSYTIPGDVTSIGDFAFAWCYGLTGITIPDGITNIGKQAFWNDNGLHSITIPASVAYIGELAFSACQGVTAITVDPASLFFCDVGGVLFDKNKNILIEYPPGASNAVYEIPDSVAALAVTMR